MPTVFLLLLAAGAALSDVGFQYRSPARARAAESVAVGLIVDAGGARVDLLVEDARTGFPRWEWADGSQTAVGRATVRAAPGSRALLVVRRPGARGYFLDGPFDWPASATSRKVEALAHRTLRGSSSPGGGGGGTTLGLVGPAGRDPLCERGSSGEWQCVAVPAGYAGRIVACDGDQALAGAEVSPDSPDAVVLRRLLSAAVVRLEPYVDGSADPAPTLRFLRPAGSRSGVLAPDREWRAANLGAGFFWLEGPTDPADLIVEIRAPGFATARLPFRETRSPCADAPSVALTRATPLEGAITDTSGRPAAGALVLVRPADASSGETIVADATTDENGAFTVSDVPPLRYRLRACHAELGCGEVIVSPGDRVTIALGSGGVYTGRVISGAGVPEPGASVRIVPSAADWAASTDRFARLPLVTVSGGDGRFKIAAPETGDFLLEIRTDTSGIARLPVSRSRFSPSQTDLGDVRLTEAVELAVRVEGCSGGMLSMSGPLGGETSLPSLVRAALDAGGAATVHLPEGGAWTAWAACGGRNVALDPALLPDVAALPGVEIRFEPGGALADQPPGSPK